MDFWSKMNSWRLGAGVYFLLQSLVLVTIFLFCTNRNVSQADSLLSGRLSHWVFMGTGILQYMFVFPFMIIFLLANGKRTALSIFVFSIIWFVVVYVLFSQTAVK
jgi:hypothetical protein